MAARIMIGTAGWTIPKAVSDAFPSEGPGLVRYAARFKAAEINSSFYRSHRPGTWDRWRDVTPPDFRFAVKAPKALTHVARLVGCEPLLPAFLSEAMRLGEKLGPLLVQLPPSLTFDEKVAEAFFGSLRGAFAGAVVCEPRHSSWFEADADALLARHRVVRALADPRPDPRAAEPGGDPHLLYVRLHGSPHMYRSSYDEEALAGLAARLQASAAGEAWCIFDNTTSGAAAANALTLSAMLQAPVRQVRAQKAARPGP